MDRNIIITCKKCGMPLKKGTKICSYCQRRTGHFAGASKPKREGAVNIRDGKIVIPIPWVSLALILLNAAIGLYKLSGGEAAILARYGMMTGALQKGEWIRFVASSFLHVSLLHLASNMYALVIYGFIFENRIGRGKYLLIYTASILGSALLINFIGGSALHIGASGAIWGLMTANLVYCLKTRRKFLYLLYALFAVAGNAVYSFAYGVSWQGHLGGAIAGVLMGLLLFSKEGKKE